MAAPLVYNGDFEIQGASDNVVVGWTTTATAGAVRNYGIAGNRVLPPRSGTANFAEQEVDFGAGGTFALKFREGWRVTAGASAEITIDGVVVWSGTGGGSQVDSVLYAAETAAFTVPAGSYTLRVQMTNTAGYGLIFDDFTFEEVATTTPARLACIQPTIFGVIA
jgi:hypothetical protein